MTARRTVAETDEQRKKRQRAEVAAYEVANGIVPGTASMKNGAPSGGQDWAGRARMAGARRIVGLPLDNFDLDALERVQREAS